MDPVSILQRVAAKYIDLGSYSDEGTVSYDVNVGETTHTMKTDFKTYFVKPENVRFEWQARPDNPGPNFQSEENAFWSDGTYCWKRFLGQLRRPSTLPAAISGATGGSQGAVNHILHLLMPNAIQIRRFWRDMVDARLVGEEDVRDLRCYRIVGTTKVKDDVEVFISKEDYMVRCLITKLTIDRESREESYKFALESAAKKGLLPDVLEQMRNDFTSRLTDEVRTYLHKCDYHTVNVNEDIPEDLFRL